MVQELIILVIFLVAAFYVGRIIYKAFTVKDGCAKGCGSCSTIDFNKIQKDLEKKKATSV